jgi:uncharacterized protein YbjT (DUF2867 family)
MTYLITGATGTVGTLVVERLIEQGERPRIFVRNAEKARVLYGDRVDIFLGDLADAATLSPALAGADALFLVNSGYRLAAQDEAAAKVAQGASVKCLVKLSSHDARERVGTGVWHAQGEAAIRAIGIPFTFIQPSGFMSNALFWERSVKTEGVVHTSTGDGKIPFIHPRDVADVVVKVLTSGAYTAESLPITGPEALSYAEMLSKIGGAIGRTLRVRLITEEQERRRMMDRGEPTQEITAHLSIYRAIREGRLGTITNTVDRVLGRKPISFDTWAQENVTAFADRVHAG